MAIEIVSFPIKKNVIFDFPSFFVCLPGRVTRPATDFYDTCRVCPETQLPRDRSVQPSGTEWAPGPVNPGPVNRWTSRGLSDGGWEKHGKTWQLMCVHIYIYIFLVGLGKWNHISLSWIKAIWGWFPLLTMISHIMYIYIYGKCVIILHWNGNFWIWQIQENSPSQLPNKLRKISCYIYIYISMISP